MIRTIRKKGYLLLSLLLCFVLSGCALPFFGGQVEEEALQSVPVPPQERESLIQEALQHLLPKSIYDLEEYQDNVYEGESLFRSDMVLTYYYDLLEEEEKAIYDALFALTRDPTSTEYRVGVRTMLNPTGEEFFYEITRAYQALVFDHAEFFWLRWEAGLFSYYYSEEVDRVGYHVVMFQLTKPYEQYEEEVTAFNAAVDTFLADIDRAQDQAEIVRDVYDKLMDLVTYDEMLADEELRAEMEYVDYGFTAYGALVANSRGEANRAVCDGYSYAYAYLLQQLGIPVIRYAGKVGKDPENFEPHSWNLVQLDGEWYEADATWDDMNEEYDPYDPEDDLFLEAEADTVFWDHIRHHLFLKTTEEMEVFIPDDSYVYYTDRGYATFLGEAYHVRDTQEEAERPDSGDCLSYLAPVATGTTYRWDGPYWTEEWE